MRVGSDPALLALTSLSTSLQYRAMPKIKGKGWHDRVPETKNVAQNSKKFTKFNSLVSVYKHKVIRH